MAQSNRKSAIKHVCLPRNRYYSFVLDTIIEEKKAVIFEKIKRNKKISIDKTRVYKFMPFR